MPIKNAGYLNGIEFKTIREELGLTQAELMRLMGIKNYQTIVRWEKGDNVISESACDTIVNMLKSAWQEITEKTDLLLERYKRTCYADFALIIYPNNPTLNAATRKAYCRFMAEGKKAHLIRWNEQDFHAFLDMKELEDTPETRERWALDYWKRNPYTTREL